MSIDNILIPNFFNTLGNDISYMLNHPLPRECSPKEEQNRFLIAGIRITGALFMTSGFIYTIRALPLAATTLGVIKLAIGVATYALGHDVFRIGNNLESHFSGYAILTAAKAKWRSFWSEKDKTPETLIEDLTRETILPWKSVGMSILDTYQERRA